MDGSQAAQRGDIYNPATGRVSGTVDYATAAEVDAAVSAAAAALPGWRETSLVKRAGVMFRDSASAGPLPARPTWPR